MEADPIEAPQVNAPPLRARQQLGRYEILERLAVGGMAEIYRARTRGPRAFEKTVALKRILPQHALDPELLQMFLDEARLMASLNHPHIAQVYDVGEDPDHPFFTMELVKGVDVRTLLRAYGRRRPLPLEHALCIGIGVASGLHHAHERSNGRGEPLGIVHRDISPSNVLVSFEGAVKITDFGVAKWAEQSSRTEAGQLKGKLAHMSPEQCRGLPLDRRTDVFALGTLLVEMLTGRPAFEAESDFELLNRIVSEDVAPLVMPDGARLPNDLDEIVRQALCRDREQRTPTAQAVQLALEDFARRHRLVVSSVALADTLAHLFADRRKAAEDAERRWLAPDPLELVPGRARELAGPERPEGDGDAGNGAERTGGAEAEPADADPTQTAARPMGEIAERAKPEEGDATRVLFAPPLLSKRRFRWVAGGFAAVALGALLWARTPQQAPSTPPRTPPFSETAAVKRVDLTHSDEPSLHAATNGTASAATKGAASAATNGAASAATKCAASVAWPVTVTPSASAAPAAPALPVASRSTRGSRSSRPGRMPGGRPVAPVESPAALPPALPAAPAAESAPVAPPPVRPKAWDPDSPVPP